VSNLTIAEFYNITDLITFTNNDSESILDLLAEGGSLTLLGIRVANVGFRAARTLSR
jgi:hypothetical protein